VQTRCAVDRAHDRARLKRDVGRKVLDMPSASRDQRGDARADRTRLPESVVDLQMIMICPLVNP
jgi:hypothetical protein